MFTTWLILGVPRITGTCATKFDKSGIPKLFGLCHNPGLHPFEPIWWCSLKVESMHSPSLHRQLICLLGLTGALHQKNDPQTKLRVIVFFCVPLSRCAIQLSHWSILWLHFWSHTISGRDWDSRRESAYSILCLGCSLQGHLQFGCLDLRGLPSLVPSHPFGLNG